MAVCARRADGVRRLFRRAGERPVAPGAGAAAVCTGSVRGAKEKPAHGVDGQAGHVRFFFAVLTEAIKIFFSSMHYLFLESASFERKEQRVSEERRVKSEE